MSPSLDTLLWTFMYRCCSWLLLNILLLFNYYGINGIPLLLYRLFLKWIKGAKKYKYLLCFPLGPNFSFVTYTYVHKYLVCICGYTQASRGINWHLPKEKLTIITYTPCIQLYVDNSCQSIVCRCMYTYIQLYVEILVSLSDW